MRCMGRKFQIAVVLSVWTAAVSAALGEERLRLADVIAEARANNPEIRAAHERAAPGRRPSESGPRAYLRREEVLPLLRRMPRVLCLRMASEGAERVQTFGASRAWTQT